MPSRPAQWALLTGSLALAVSLLVVVIPRATGADWGDTGETLEGVPLSQLPQMLVVWAAGLWLHTFVLRAALPGLRVRRAFALNLGGSSVANVLPLGGAAGIGLNYAMLRSWGYTRVQISTYAAVSNFVVALVKVCIALAGIAILLLSPVAGVDVLPHVSKAAVVVAAAVAGAAVVALSVAWRTQRGVAFRDGFRRAMAGAVLTVRRRWWAMAFGGVGYPALQVMLLWLCLRGVGANVGVPAVLLTYAVQCLLTLVPFTPGGVGVVETGASAVLISVGVSPAAAVAGFLLFRVFSYLVEIPLGGAIAVCWFSGRWRTSPAT